MTLVTADNKATGSSTASNPTLRDIIYRALRRLNLYSIRETPADNEVNACINEFNDMLQGWYLENIIVSYTTYTLSDTPSIPIGTTNPLYYTDCLVDNLSVRLIELFDLNPKNFGQIYMRASRALDKVTNLKREKEFDGSTFRSDFDETLKNTPDVDRTYTTVTASS